MRYDKKIQIIKKEIVEDELGGVSSSINTLLKSVDAFISPETIKVIDINNGLKVRKGMAKVFTKAKIELDANKQIKITVGGYNRIALNRINIIPTDSHENITIISGATEYEVYSITDLGKLTMIEVERYV